MMERIFYCETVVGQKPEEQTVVVVQDTITEHNDANFACFVVCWSNGNGGQISDDREKKKNKDP